MTVTSRRLHPAASAGNRIALLCLLLAPCFLIAGCNVNGFFDPSKTGRFREMSTLLPILERLDVIEREENEWGQTTGVFPEDHIPNDLTYRMAPGDVLTVQIFELYRPGEWAVATRRIDASGSFRVRELGDVPAAGLTPQEFEDDLIERLREMITSPQVDVVVEDSGGLTYTIYGGVGAPGIYTLRRPDLRLLDALAVSGGVARSVDKIYVIRQLPLTEEVLPPFERQPGRPTTPPDEESPPVDIEDLIEQMPEGPPSVSPGVLEAQEQPAEPDVEEPEPVQFQEQVPVDVDELTQAATTAPARQQPRSDFVYDEERGQWVRVQVGGAQPARQAAGGEQPEMILERVIEIDYKDLRSDGSLNLVIRPKDRIYVNLPDVGVVYIDGEIARSGVYQLPPSGKVTLSRLVAAAGGLGPLAIPERVDLTRIVAPNREATVRLNLAAIRNGTEPDLYLKPDDHILIGTNWLATPLAIFRSGFRTTYGFGFLLDRNFGNDVFGAPPVNISGQ